MKKIISFLLIFIFSNIILIGADEIINDNLVINDNGKGIALKQLDSPFITRGWDPFTSGKYSNLGRWGMFMEN